MRLSNDYCCILSFYWASTANRFIKTPHLLQQIALAKEFEQMVRGDRQYEIIGEVTMGLVCFRVKVSVSVIHHVNFYMVISHCLDQFKTGTFVLCGAGLLKYYF